jgi:hypothetical protein
VGKVVALAGCDTDVAYDAATSGLGCTIKLCRRPRAVAAIPVAGREAAGEFIATDPDEKNNYHRQKGGLLLVSAALAASGAVALMVRSGRE